MSPAKVRVGILGGGGILGAHAPALRAQAARCDIVAVAEPDAARHARVRQLCGAGVRLVADYHEVLAMPEVDAVVILLPHFLHEPATVAAAQAGKPVLVEKVMARNVHECDRMMAACEAAGVSLTVCHDRRYHGEWEALKTVIASGILGEVFFWKLDHNQDVVFPEGAWVRSRAGLGGGAIMSCLTHQIDALRWYGGEVREVACMARVTPDRMEGESLGVVLATMVSGALAELSINWRTRSHQGANSLWYEMVQVCGTWGEAYRMSGRGTFLKLTERAPREAVAQWGDNALRDFVPVPCQPHGGHAKAIEQWLRHLRGEPAELRTTGRDCRGTVEVAEAAYRALAEKRVITLPIVPRPWAATDTLAPSGTSTASASYQVGG